MTIQPQSQMSGWGMALVLSLVALATPNAICAQGFPRPGEDFYGYANEQWLKATNLPPGKERWGARDEVNATTRQRVAQLLVEAKSAPSGSPGRKIADFRAAWLDQAAIEAKGVAPLRPSLDSIDRIRDRPSLAHFLGHWVRADVDPLNWGVYQSSHLLGLSVETSIHGEKTFVAFLVQGGLGLPDRADYLSTEGDAPSLRARYRAYIARLLTLAGFDRADARAAAVVAFETALAQRQATHDASANDRNADSVWTKADFARRAPGMDWPIFFDAAGLGKEAAIGAWQPGALVGIAELVASQPLQTWQDYLRFHLLDENADLLPAAFADASASLHTAPGSTRPTRPERALDATQLAMSDLIGLLYAERYFPLEQKSRVRNIVAHVAAAFRRRVENAPWLSPTSRKTALAKLDGLYVGIGFPDKWPPFSDLRIDPSDAVGNQRRVAEWNYRRTLSRLGQPVDRSEWMMAPQTAGAILNFQQNAYDFAAALLMAPKYDPNMSDAAAYGAIGAIIGHDISHFVDLLGAEYDVDGAMHSWWTADDKARFGLRTAPLVAQFSAYHPFPDLSIDGKASESENVADLAGLAAAFDAYRLTLGAHLTDTAYVRSHDREFFLAFARSWPVRLSDAAMRKQSVSDHAPEMYRVSTVRNFDAWYEAFGVVPGDRLYLAPNDRVRIW